MVAIRLEGIRKSFGNTDVLKGIDLSIADGEFVVFVGPSGCGKSTLLRVIAGLEEASGGELYFGDQRYTDVAPARRGVAMVFQSYALYPHMTVAENMTMSLRLAGVPKPARRAEAEQVARMLQLTELLDRKPSQLSGGQRQRVAIGRALVRKPDVYLFDEPLSNLDAALRVETRVGISQLHAQLKATMIYVTHDQVEAMTMADRIVILDQGRIAQVGSPMELYRAPANVFVGGFIGSPKMNFLPVTELGREGGTVRLRRAGGATLALDLGLAAATPVTQLGIRPEHLAIAADGPIDGAVSAVEHLGSETLVYVATDEGTLISKVVGDVRVRAGETIRLAPQPETTHGFAADGAAIPRQGSSAA